MTANEPIQPTHHRCPEAPGPDDTHHLIPKAGVPTCVYCKKTHSQLVEDVSRA